jgi:tetrahydromethanopterin S-methyltransferase subunit B
MWLNELKIAVVEKDVKQLSVLLENIPVLSDAKEIESAIYLLKEATVIVEALKDETAASMLQIKKNIDFLDATRNDKQNKLDITS